jgi:hypothetical protein
VNSSFKSGRKDRLTKSDADREGILGEGKRPRGLSHLFFPRFDLPGISLIYFCIILFLSGCAGLSVKSDLVMPPDFRPSQYQRLAVINLDPQVRYGEYVEAELVRKGYKVKESYLVRQLLPKEGEGKDGFFDLAALKKIGDSLDVQGVVLCSVLEFSRFRDSYRLNMKMVSVATGTTIWLAQGAKEGKRGQRSSELLREIVVASLQKLPVLK